jgi:RND family efflux transporter MFP subunit
VGHSGRTVRGPGFYSVEMKPVYRLCGCLALCAGLTTALTSPISAADRPLEFTGWAQQGSQSPAAAVGDTFGIKTIARASHDATMGFSFPTEIAEIVARGGQRVKKGDVLIRGRDEELRAQRDLQQVAAETELPVQRAHAAMEQARVEYEAQESVRQKNRASANIEVERARTAYILRRVEHELSMIEQTQQQLQLRFRQAQLDRLQLIAPFDGIVDMVACEVGEVKRDGEPVLRLVGNDRLWLDVHTPAFQAIELAIRNGHSAWIMMDLPGEPRIFQGKVIEVGAEVDSASKTRRIRVELPNPHEWPSGLNAWVRFTPPEEQWMARVETLPTAAADSAPRLGEAAQPARPGAKPTGAPE